MFIFKFILFSRNYKTERLKFSVYFYSLKEFSAVRSHFATNVVLGDYKQLSTNMARESTLRNEELLLRQLFSLSL